MTTWTPEDIPTHALLYEDDNIRPGKNVAIDRNNSGILYTQFTFTFS